MKWVTSLLLVINAFTYYAYLVKELFPCGAGLDGKLQLCIHGGHTDIDLRKLILHIVYGCNLIFV